MTRPPAALGAAIHSPGTPPASTGSLRASGDPPMSAATCSNDARASGWDSCRGGRALSSLMTFSSSGLAMAALAFCGRFPASRSFAAGSAGVDAREPRAVARVAPPGGRC